MTIRAIWALLTGLAYLLATIPLTVAGFVLVPFAIWFGVERPSRITGRPIFTAPDWLGIYGNEQDGFDPAWAVETIYKGWPTFWRRYSWAAWRNAIRNLCFVDSLAFLHRPKGELVTRERKMGAVTFRIRYRGWMTELEYFTATRFGDFGPRLDHPDAWAGCDWAFRPFGRL